MTLKCSNTIHSIIIIMEDCFWCATPKCKDLLTAILQMGFKRMTHNKNKI